MRFMVLLGAGASAEAGVPMTLDMTTRIADRFRSDPAAELESRIISFVLGGLLFQKGVQGEDPYGGVDVEELFAAVQLLAQRHHLQAAPFVGSWHSMVDEFDKVRAGSRFQMRDFTRKMAEATAKQLDTALPRHLERGSAIDQALQQALEGRSGARAALSAAISQSLLGTLKKWLRDSARRGSVSAPMGLDRAFAKAVDATQSRSGEGTVFEEVGEAMIAALRDLVWIDDPHEVSYLQPITSLAAAQQRMVVATLNYDNAVELLCESQGTNCTTGIATWSKEGRFPITDQWGIALLKLHGSIDWILYPPSSENDSGMPHARVEKATPDQLDEGQYRPAVVFGQGSKLTAQGPYLDLLHSFREALADATNLIVVGYSFRDDHINEYISQWLNQSADNKLTVINPGFRSLRVRYTDYLSALEGTQVTIRELSASAGLAREITSIL